MPAVTADHLRLPRLEGPPRDALERPVLSVTTAPTGRRGVGCPFRRAFAAVTRALLDPLASLDQMGSWHYAPSGSKGTRSYPHRGSWLVTYMTPSRFQHPS